MSLEMTNQHSCFPKVIEAPSLQRLSWLVKKLILQCPHNNLIFCDGLFHFSNPASVITVFSVICMINGNRLDWAMFPVEQLVFMMRHSGWVALAPSNSGSESSGKTLSEVWAQIFLLYGFKMYNLLNLWPKLIRGTKPFYLDKCSLFKSSWKKNISCLHFGILLCSQTNYSLQSAANLLSNYLSVKIL